MANAMRTFRCEEEGCGAPFVVPVHRGRRHHKCEAHRPGGTAQVARRDRVRAVKASITGPGTIPAPAPVTVATVAAKATGDPVSDALAEAQAATERLAQMVAERQAAEEAGTFPKAVPMPDGLTHYAFPKLLRHLRCERQPYLCGPSGSGKTWAAEQAAKAIGARTFDVLSCNAETSGIDFFGYMDANGHFVEGVIYEAWTYGGVVLFDEMDACEPNALVKLCAVLAMSAGQAYRFPNGERIPRHPDFRPIGAGNTNGAGASEAHNAREAFDAAILSRFTFIEWGIDEDLERAMVPSEHVWWAERVQALRKAAKAASAQIMIDPRMTLNGVAFLADGEATVDEIHDECVWKGASEDTRNTVLAYV